ncbi:hypothetical protein CR513_46158, partial [Mucuna pruriens]
MRHYDMFTMKDDETIDEMFGRFQTILNSLTSLVLRKNRNISKLSKLKCLIQYSSSDTTNDEISLMSRMFKQILKKKEKEVICFECKKPELFKVDYPKLRKRWYPKKKKSLMAT